MPRNYQQVLYQEDAFIQSILLRIRNRDTRVLVYAAISFVCVSAIYFYGHQASCRSDAGSSFCRGGLSPALVLITISVMTIGGTMLALAVIERNIGYKTGLITLGFLIALIGFALAIFVMID